MAMNPPPMVPSHQIMQDAEHMKLLAIFYYVFGGLSCFGSLFGVLYIAMGTMFSRIAVKAAASSPGAAPPAEMGSIIIVIGVVITLLCVVMGVGSILTGRWISARKNKTFCLVVAGISCLSVPFGTVLGVFTFLILSRPTVAALFEGQSPLTTPHA